MYMYKGRDTLGDKSQRRVSVTSRSVCTASKQIPATRRLFIAHANEFGTGGMCTSFPIHHVDAISLVNLYFVAATCRKREHTLLSLILSLRSFAQIQTGSNLCDTSHQQILSQRHRLLQECTMSHKATCCSNLSPQNVAVTCRLVCPDLNVS